MHALSASDVRRAVAQIRAAARRGTAGFSLIEILVAMLVLSIGALGVANLQIIGILANGSGDQRAQATLLVNELLDRIRANRVGALAGNYDIDAATPAPADPGCMGSGADCTPAEQANADLAAWRSTISNALVSASGSAVVNDPAGEPSVTVTITWVAAGAGATADGGDRSVLTMTAGL